jgi:hypothetical protein
MDPLFRGAQSYWYPMATWLHLVLAPTAAFRPPQLLWPHVRIGPLHLDKNNLKFKQIKKKLPVIFFTWLTLFYRANRDGATQSFATLSIVARLCCHVEYMGPTSNRAAPFSMAQHTRLRRHRAWRGTLRCLHRSAASRRHASHRYAHMHAS